MMRSFLLLLSLATVTCNKVVGAQRRDQVVVEGCSSAEEFVSLYMSFDSNDDEEEDAASLHANLGWTLTCDDEIVWIVQPGTFHVDATSDFATYTKCLPLDVNLCELAMRNYNGGEWPWYSLFWGATTVAVSSNEEEPEHGDIAFSMERKYCFGAGCTAVPLEIQDEEYANEEENSSEDNSSEPKFGIAAIIGLFFAGTAVSLILTAAAGMIFYQCLKKKGTDLHDMSIPRTIEKKPNHDSESIAESSTTTDSFEIS